MKGKFNANSEILQNTLKSAEPYAVITVSTTGLDNADFDGHEPIRVCVQEFVWSDTIKQYEEGLSFDRMVKCSEEALQKAVENADSYDVFANGGIDREAYIRGEGVSDRAEFARSFTDFMKGLQSETLLITNGAGHVNHYLEKVNCNKPVLDKLKQGRLLDQTHLTKDYFTEKGISAKSSLEAINDYMTGRENGTIIGGDERIKVISSFVTRYGREKGILEDERTAAFREADTAVQQSYIDRGKEKYRSADFEGKLDILVNAGNIQPDAIMDRNGQCDLNSLFDVLEGKNGAKGFTVMQTATTGFRAGNAPIQVTITAYDVKDGVPVPTGKGIFLNIKTDNRNIQQMIQMADNPPSEKDRFDAFSYAGIDRDKYLRGEGVVTQEEALKRISEYFRVYTTQEYPVVTNGTSKNSGKSFTQDSLKKLGSLPAFNAPHIDFTQAVKEYCYLAYNNPDYQNNAIIDVNRWNEDNFGLQNIAQHNRAGNIDGSNRKCLYVGMLITGIAEQQKEMSKEAAREFEDEKGADIIDDEILADIISEPDVRIQKKPLRQQTAGQPAARPSETDKLLAVITEQNAMLKQQNEVLARQNEALIASSQQIIQMYAEQQQIMMYIIGMGQDREVFKNIKPVERKIAGDR
ncbi:MAG: hypothetical protein NC548_55765 [Lachnospiraceae bacterium]|nr:hypothetical protein [Lachnospiraceae bacterium]